MPALCLICNYPLEPGQVAVCSTHCSYDLYLDSIGEPGCCEGAPITVPLLPLPCHSDSND